MGVNLINHPYSSFDEPDRPIDPPFLSADAPPRVHQHSILAIIHNSFILPHVVPVRERMTATSNPTTINQFKHYENHYSHNGSNTLGRLWTRTIGPMPELSNGYKHPRIWDQIRG